MSFLKISDPAKRDAIVKEYLELKKNIRNNLLSERTGEMELQTDLSKFYRPITETQKATAREITEGLKPIREGIEKLPQAMQPIGEATGEAPEEEVEEEDDELIGEIAKKYLNRPNRDKTFGIVKIGDHHYIGDNHVIVRDNDILVRGERFRGTSGLWELITSNTPQNYNEEDRMNYEDLMIMTNALHRNNDEDNPYPKGNKGYKWNNILCDIWCKKKSYKVYKFPKKKEGYEGEGVVVIPSDPNPLLERLDLLIASQEAGHTGVGNELVSICDELKRQGVLDTKTYKKLNSYIKI